MKKTVSFFMVFTFLLSIAYAQKEKKAEAEKINWLSFKEATEQNKKNPKKIFIDTYTDWCGWCKRMDVTTFEDKEVVAIMNKYFYAIKFNAEGKDTILYNGKTYTNMNPTNARGTHQLAVELLNGKLGYPTSVYLDEQMKLLQPIPGYMDAKSFKQVLIYFAEDYNKKMSWEDFQQNYDELMEKKEAKPEKKKKKSNS